MNKVILSDPRPPHLRQTTTEELNNFLISQQSFPKPTMWNDCLIAYQDYDLTNSRKSILLELTDTFLQEMAASISNLPHSNLSTSAGIHVSGTEQQSATVAWQHQRKFRITASSFQDFHRNPSLLTYNKLWAREKDISSLPSVKWGLQSESTARKNFEEQCNMAVEICGLFVSKLKPWIGASPDGIGVDKDFILEIKCPYVLRHTSPDDLTSLTSSQQRNFFCEIKNQRLCLKKTHKYFWQVQQQMWVTGIPLTKFVV